MPGRSANLIEYPAMARFLFIPLFAALFLLGTGCQQVVAPEPVSVGSAAGGYAAVPEPSTSDTAYVFGWGALPASLAQPRGGSTDGAPVSLAPARALPLPEIAAAADDLARDRAAILALAGDYRVGFHFMESLGLEADYQPVRPYHSWATEQVRVVEDTGRFISLQHTLVMFFDGEAGAAMGPVLTKHWRQDWTYEDRELHTFRGANVWARRRPAAAEVAGAWSQAVFQVDDSPRYEALGRWEHRGNTSVWASERAWRPLPRREFSVRSDYGVLEGGHRIVLTPTGWLHEQTNWKRLAGEAGGAAAKPHFVAAEIGLDRYERITAPSLAAADEYWKRTGAYWAEVRRAWRDVFRRHERFVLRPEAGGRRLFEVHFEYADGLAERGSVDAADLARHARETIGAFVQPVP
jgi:hypothetical protein